jgi:hypothetical protein
MAPTSGRSLLPHEHGAYGQLLFPIACGLSLGRPGAAAWLLSAGAVAGFLSYEPLLVLAGNRGPRAREQDGARALRLAAGLLAAAAALAGWGFLLAPAPARAVAVVPPLLAAGVALLARLRVERTVGGELAVAVALSSAGFPVAVAAGVAAGTAASAWLAWCLGFSAATLAVEVVLARARAPARDPGPPAAAAILMLQAVPAVLALVRLLPAAVPAAVAPMALASLLVIGLRVPARRLQRVGWSAVAASLAALLVLLAGLR